MPRQALLLLFGLDRDKTHPRGVQCREHRFGIPCIVPDPLIFAIRFYKLSRDEPRLKTQRLHCPTPTVRCAARFHRHYRTARQRAQSLHKLAVLHDRRSPAMTMAIAPADRENVLCQIDTNCRSIHPDFPFLHFRLIDGNSILAHRCRLAYATSGMWEVLFIVVQTDTGS